ncbi:MAG: hypothetical protein IJ604_10795 [Prevotella sp.]|nr:hypothetical protein [Prevotella sp.]
MKKLILAIVLALPLMAEAQNAQVTLIRKQYAEAKQQVALIEKGTSSMGFGHTVVTSNYTMPGSGPVKETIHYYYRGKTDDRTEEFYLFPFLVTRNYNIGADDHYEEYLYNECGDGIAFFFQKNAYGETRYYWNTCADKNFFHEDIKGNRGLDEVFAARQAADFRAAFDKLMNREY